MHHALLAGSRRCTTLSSSDLDGAPLYPRWILTVHHAEKEKRQRPWRPWRGGGLIEDGEETSVSNLVSFTVNLLQLIIRVRRGQLGDRFAEDNIITQYFIQLKEIHPQLSFGSENSGDFALTRPQTRTQTPNRSPPFNFGSGQRPPDPKMLNYPFAPSIFQNSHHVWAHSPTQT